MFLPNSEAIQLMKQKRLSVFLRNNQYISVCICFIPQNSCTENKQIIYQCVIVTSKRENIKKKYTFLTNGTMMFLLRCTTFKIITKKHHSFCTGNHLKK